jgi:hypothetical protein
MSTRTITMSHEELDRFEVISRVREREELRGWHCSGLL